jgi:hypothetical protein
MHILPWKPQGGAGGSLEPLLIRQIDPYRVEWWFNTGCARRRDDPGAGVPQLRLFAGPRHVDIKREVPGTEGNPPDPGTGRQNLVDLAEAARRFDDRDQIDRARPQPMLSFDLRKKPVDRRKPSRGFDFREDDAVETGPNDRHQIAIAKLGVDRIDANIEELPPRARQRRDNRIPRRSLLGHGHGILEIEDDRVGIERQRLLDPPCVIPRRKQKAA